MACAVRQGGVMDTQPGPGALTDRARGVDVWVPVPQRKLNEAEVGTKIMQQAHDRYRIPGRHPRRSRRVAGTRVAISQGKRFLPGVAQ